MHIHRGRDVKDVYDFVGNWLRQDEGLPRALRQHQFKVYFKNRVIAPEMSLKEADIDDDCKVFVWFDLDDSHDLMTQEKDMNKMSHVDIEDRAELRMGDERQEEQEYYDESDQELKVEDY